MGYSKDGSVKIDVSLNMDQVDRDFDQLVRLAKESARSVVKVSADIATAMEETVTGARQAGQEIEKSVKGNGKFPGKGGRECRRIKKRDAGAGGRNRKNQQRTGRSGRSDRKDQTDSG